VISRVTPANVQLFDRAARTFGAAADGCQEFVRSPGALAFVASHAEEILGWCWGYHLIRPDISSKVYLHRLEVARENRRRGIGRARDSAGTVCGESRRL
jgi:ribosomal protein S18 acetylase RimI-like enzyme